MYWTRADCTGSNDTNRVNILFGCEFEIGLVSGLLFSLNFWVRELNQLSLEVGMKKLALSLIL